MASTRTMQPDSLVERAGDAVDAMGDRLQAPVRRHAETVQRVGRVGWVAKGFLYVALAILMWQLARQGGSSESADQQGALAELSADKGAWLIGLVAFGLFAYALWRLCEAFLASSERALDRAGAAVSGLLHLGLGVLATRIALDGDDAGSGSGGASTDQQAAGLMGHTWGRLLIGVVGVVLLGVAVEQVRRAWTASFMRTIDSTDFQHERSAIEVLGRVGHAARAVVYAIVGGFLTVAAFQADRDDAKGLDGSLREVAEHAWGDTLLAVTAVGLAIYGLYCIVSSRHQVLPRH
jgi:hypothetical protein